MKTCLLLLANITVHVLSEDENATCGDRCCPNFYKDKYNRSCVECPLGTYGLNCAATCPRRYYGRFCISECDCSLRRCDNRYGCLEFEAKNGSGNTWKYVAFTVIGSITTLVVVGLMMLIKSLFDKRCTLWREILESNENETENTDEEHIYEGRRSLQSIEEVENEQPNEQADENNYTDLRRSALFPIYDNPEKSKPGPNSNAAPADAAKSLALWDLSIDEEDDSSDEEENEDEGYGQLFKHEMYNVLSLRRTYPDKSTHVRLVSDDTMISTSSKETPDGYQSIQLLATSKVPGSKVETSKKLSRSLSEKATLRQSLISETIEEYIQTSKVTRNLNVLEDEQQDLVMTESKSQTESTGIGKPLQKNTWPYSLAKTSWTSDSKQDPITKTINEDDINEYDVVNKDDVDVNIKDDENAYDDVNKEDDVNGDDDADKDDVNKDNDRNEKDNHGNKDDDVYEKSRPNIKSNEGNESTKGNDILQKSYRQAECENQPKKTPKDEEILSSSLTISPQDDIPNQEYTQVLKKRMLPSTENEISENNAVEVYPVVSKKTIGFSLDEKDKALPKMCSSQLVGADEENLKSSADMETSENDILDITYRIINTTNL